ncbi:DUF5572 domain-containing protein [Sporobolomyces salmoneus]|uniref:DUF5572 domain-containing protein n=1 Tax=Sporobolomyces salmoneus TaxID=183962 RepID=UPI00317977BE
MSTSTTTTHTENGLYYTPRTTITDPLFLQGLSSILAPYYERQATPDEIQEVTERAESFYLSSQASQSQPSPAPTESLTSVPLISSSSSENSPSTSTATSASTSTNPDEPPYPLSFAHLAHLISTGAPIPGIKEIPDKLTEERPSESTREVRRKPWEKENFEAEEEEHDRLKREGEGEGEGA